MITLVLAFHNHQPVGNFGWVIEDAYRKAYRPLMETLAEFPSIRFAQHYTGILLDWFQENHPEFIATIAQGVAGNRIELLSGGYYEPILAMLPERDRHAQITMLNRAIADRFATTPGGMWLAERVWEPSLPSTLHDAGIAYTILDDTHFKAAGLSDRDLGSYFLTEDQGRPLAVFPIDKRLRYTMPFEAPEVTIDYLRSLDEPGRERIVVFADDGEKFGVWPETYHTVYKQGWLRSFCRLLEQNASWLVTVPPGEALRTHRPAGRLYLPTASYAEMLHWALPSPEAFTAFEDFEHALAERGLDKSYGQFVRGGFWRNFLVKYPEINAMQKKMLRVSGRLDAARRSGAGASDPAALEEAARHVMAAQCNCPHWHGVFGGVYLANIRAAMYRQMITAETILDRLEGAGPGRVEVTDYDLDGDDEIIYESAEASLYIAPALGGHICEFDYKPARYNFIDLVARRREGYHRRLGGVAAPEPAAAPTAPGKHGGHDASLDGSRPAADTGPADGTAGDAHRSAEPASAEEGGAARSIHDIVRVKESGLERILHYDSYRHALLVDHFLGDAPDADSLRRCELDEIGDFVSTPYDFEWTRRDSTVVVALRRTGHVKRIGRVLVEKAVSINDGSADIHVDYRVRSLDGTTLGGRFGIEMAYAMSAGTEPDRYYEFGGVRPRGASARLDSSGAHDGTDFALVDEWLGAKIHVHLERPATIVRAPIETVSLSEEGFEKNYQGSIVLAVWELGPVSEWHMALDQRITRLH